MQTKGHRVMGTGKRERMATIDDRCDLAAYMAGVWEAYIWSSRLRILQDSSGHGKIEASTKHLTSNHLEVPHSLLTTHLLFIPYIPPTPPPHPPPGHYINLSFLPRYTTK